MLANIAAQVRRRRKIEAESDEKVHFLQPIVTQITGKVAQITEKVILVLAYIEFL